MKKKFTIRDIEKHFAKSDRPLYMETSSQDGFTKVRIMFNDGSSIYSLTNNDDIEFNMSCFCTNDFGTASSKYDLDLILENLPLYNYNKGITYMKAL